MSPCASPPNILGDLRADIAAVLQTALGTSVDVAPHGGNFTEAELNRFMARAPAVRVALLGFGAAAQQGSGYALPINFSAVVLTRDAPLLQRDMSAMALAAAVALALGGRCIGGCAPPENMRARAEYSGGADKSGIALWEVTWGAAYYINTNTGFSDGPAQMITALSQIWINGSKTDDALIGEAPTHV